MANITLLGASYTDVPAVTLPQTGGGTVTFYESGGGEPTYETYFDDSINADNGISIASLADLYFADGETWRVTWDGVEYICTTAQYQGWLWTVGNQSLASTDDGVNEPFLLYNYGGGAMNGNARTGGTHTLKLEKQTSGGGGDATLITKTITANGTYLASDDDADGYSSVTVNVAGGASNIVTGTFKGTTTGAAMDVNLNYSGTGYPIAMMIYPSNTDASTFQSTIQRLAVRDCMLEKYAKATSPSYSGTGDADGASLTAKYKSSSSNSASYSNGGSTGALSAVYQDTKAANGISSIVKIRSKTKMSVFIASSSYGFMANIEYSYVVIYSS